MSFFNNIEFVNKEFFWLLLLIPVFIFWYWWRRRKNFAELKLPTIAAVKNISSSARVKLQPIVFVLRILAFALLVMAMARPQSSLNEENITTEGIDIVLAIDVSTSMLAEDFKPNRIEAAKMTAMDFIDGRPTDRIGLVIFGGESFTQCPITTDQAVLKNQLKNIKEGLVEDGTAIGMGLATAVNRLKNSEAKSKTIILLTDGVNNAGFIDPLTAAEVARPFGIRVYTIGVGTMGMAPYPVQTPWGIQYQNVEVQIDEELLKKIAEMTDGKYFRATNNNKLREIYKEIDRLEKTKIEVTSIQRYSEEFLGFALLAGLLLVSEVFLRNSLFRHLT